MGRLASGLFALAVALASCREPSRLALRHDDAGGRPTIEAPESLGARASGSAGGDAAATTPTDGGAGAVEGGALRPPTQNCPGNRAPDACQTRGDSSKGVRLVGTLLTPDAVLTRGVLDLDAEGNVTCAACDCGRSGEKLVIDCPDSVISPGFINLHDHLGYAGTPPLAHPGELYEHRSEWRLGEQGHEALPFEGSASKAEMLAQELRMVLGGATSIVGAGGKQGLLRNLEAPGLDEGALPGVIVAQTFPLDDARSASEPAACRFGAMPDTRQASQGARAYLPHVGEGTNPRARDELRCALGSLNLLASNSAVVHAMALTRSDAERLAERGASVIWSPRSNLDLYGRTAPVALLASLGVHVALGTDWLASGSMNLLRELACAEQYDAQVLGGYFDAYQRWRMVTENAAWALGLEHDFGALAPRQVGDLAVFRAKDDGDPYARVSSAQPSDVRLVLRQGQPLTGDAAIIEAFEAGEACEALDVCGTPKRVCVLETGLDLASIQAAGEAVYPLFSCEEPPEEPRCEARVARECPVDEAECEAPDPPPAWDRIDSDADRVPDVRDVCPRVADARQADRDADGRGDACDPCPVANPGLMACPLRIAELRAPPERAAQGLAVTLLDVRVTAIGKDGFYVEDGDRAPYSGLFAYTDAAPPTLSLGEAVALRGYFEHFEGTDELTHVDVVKRRVVGDYDPFSLSIADATQQGAERWTGMLVRLDDLAVDAQNPDAPKDYDETQLSGGLRLDDALLLELDNTYAAGQKFAALQGIFGFSFGHFKLWPRASSDLILRPEN